MLLIPSGGLNYFYYNAVQRCSGMKQVCTLCLELAQDYKTQTNIYAKDQHSYKLRNSNELDEFSVMDEVIFATMKSLFLILKTTVQVLRIWCAMCRATWVA